MDVCSELLRLTLRVICDAGFGYVMGQAEMEQFLADMEEASKEYVMRQLANPAHMVLSPVIPSARTARRAAERLVEVGARLLRAYRALPPEERATRPGTILGFVDANDKYANDRERHADLLSLLIGGRPAARLGWMERWASLTPT